MTQFEPVGVTATVRGFTTFMTRMGSMNRAIRASGVAGTAAAVGMGALNVAISAVAITAVAVAAAVVAITAAIAGLGLASLQTAISVEDAFAGVLKTTQNLGTNLFDLTEQGKRVFQEFRDMATQIPLTFEALADIGQLGGQLGIPEDQITSFTETIAALGVSTNLTAEEAALGLARLAAVFQIETDNIAANIEQQASALVFLGNNYAAMEKDILLSSRNIAGSAAIIGMSQADIFGIATAFNIAGVRAEAGGTAVQRALLKIDEEVRNVAAGVPSALDGMAKHMGITAEEFATQWEEDAGMAFVTFVKGLAASGDDATEILADFDSESARALRTFLGLANASTVLESAVIDANMAFEQNTALAREAAIRFETMKSRLQILKNTFRDVALTIGLQLAPALQGFLDIDFTRIGEAIKNEIPNAFKTIVNAVKREAPKVSQAIEDAFGVDLDIDLGQALTSASIQTAVQDLSTAISDTITDISNFITKTSELKIAIEENAIAAFEELTRVINEDVMPVIQPLIDSIGELSTTISGDFPLISENATIVGNALSSLFGPILLQKIDNVKNSLDELTTFWDTWGQSIINITSLAFLAVGLIFQVGGLLWNTILQSVVAGLLGTLTAFGLLLQGQWQAAWDQLVLTFSNIGLQLTETATLIWDEILGIFGLSLDDLAVLFVEGLTELWNSLKTVGVFLWQEAKKIAEKIVEKFNEINWFSLGESIIKGIAAGVVAAAVHLVEAVVDAVTGARTAGEEAAGADSPAKAFMPLGEDIAKGMAAGIVNATNLAEQAAQSMTARTIEMSARVIQTQGSGGSSVDRSFNPTVHANYSQNQSPQDIAGDLVLINAARGG